MFINIIDKYILLKLIEVVDVELFFDLVDYNCDYLKLWMLWVDVMVIV